MARKKKHPEHVNHERWLVSYADFITLLFAFFVVMFAVSQVDSKKLGHFTESFSKAVGLDFFPEAGKSIMGGEMSVSMAGKQEESDPDMLPKDLEKLKIALQDMQKRSELPASLQLVQRRHELVVRLAENPLFDPGDDTLKRTAAAELHAVAAALAPVHVDVRIEGHTDDRPIHTSRFRSNWDLSTARATAVIAVLLADGLAPERLSAAGYGEFHPVAANGSEDGRRQNRRVDLVITVAAKDAPVAESAQ